MKFFFSSLKYILAVFLMFFIWPTYGMDDIEITTFEKDIDCRDLDIKYKKENRAVSLIFITPFQHGELPDDSEDIPYKKYCLLDLTIVTPENYKFEMLEHQLSGALKTSISAYGKIVSSYRKLGQTGSSIVTVVDSDLEEEFIHNKKPEDKLTDFHTARKKCPKEKITIRLRIDLILEDLKNPKMKESYIKIQSGNLGYKITKCLS